MPAANPFKGLRPFREEDAGDFHGRDGLVTEIIGGLGRDPTLVAVVGPSGSGKSSVVRAGVIPALRAGALTGSEDWVIAQMTPGEHPFAELEAALARLGVDLPPGSTRDAERSSSNDALLHSLLRALPDESSTLLLVIDQFEELFTLTDEAGRDQFITSLVSALDDVRARIRVLVTLRADFYGRPLAYPELASRLSGNVVNVTMLTTDELHAAAVEPATAAGVRFEPAALAALVADVGRELGALPLFQYALTELFDHRDGDLLTVEAYLGMGGVDGALGRRADELFDELDSNQQRAARELLLRLVTLGDDDTRTRRRAPAAEIVSLNTDVVTLQAVIERFGRHRLLAFDKDLVTDSPTLEVAHEALLTAWPTLSAWIDESRGDLERLASLRRFVEEWLAADEHPDYLATGSRLDELEAWSPHTEIALTAEERRYVVAATARRDADLRAEAARHDREARRLRSALGATAVGLVLALIAGGFAFVQQGRADDRAAEADRQARIATVQAIAARVGGLIALDPVLALAVAAEVQVIVDPAPVGAAGSLILAREAFASDEWQRLVPPINAPIANVGAIEVAPGGQSAIAIVGEGAGNGSVGGDGLKFYDVWSGEALDDIPQITGQVLAFSPDGSAAYLGDSDGAITVVDRRTGDRLGALSGVVAHEAAVVSIAVSPDGTLLASGDIGGTMNLWDIPAGTPRSSIQVADETSGRVGQAVLGLAFSPDGAVLAAVGGAAGGFANFQFGGDEGFLGLIDVVDGVALDLVETPRITFDVAFSPDGSTLATAGADAEYEGVVQLWNPRTGDPLPPLADDDLVGARAVSFSPDGDLLLAAGLDEVRAWNARSGAIVDSSTLSAEETLAAVRPPLWAFAFGEHQVLAARYEGSRLRRWSRTFSDTLGRSVIASSGAVHAVAYSPVGDLVATGGSDGTVRLWDPGAVAEVGVALTTPGGIASLAFSADGSSLVAGDFDGGVWSIDPRTSSADLLVELPRSVRAVAHGPDGMVLAAVAGGVRVVDPGSRRDLPQQIDLPLQPSPFGGIELDESTPEEITGLALSPDGSWVAASGATGDVYVLELDGSAEEMELLTTHKRSANGVAISGDGTTLASAGSDGTVHLFDLQTRERLRVLPAIDPAVESVAFSPDGRLLVTADSSGAITFWSLETGLQLASIIGHDRSALSVDISPSGTHVASGSRDGTLRIWDILDPTRACELATPIASATRVSAELGPRFEPSLCDYG